MSEDEDVSDVETNSNNDALIAFARQVLEPKLMELKRGTAEEAAVIAMPKGLELYSIKELLDEYLDAPERKKGTARLTSLASFIDHANRFKDGNSAIFADDTPDAPKLLSVLDYHEGGEDGSARFGQHRGFYAFPTSEPWKIWNRFHGEELTQAQFAQFIEDRITDVVDPKAVTSENGGDKLWDFAEGLGILIATRTQLVELSKGLTIARESNIAEHIDVTSGESRIRFDTKHKDAGGAPLVVPGGFCVAIPVFRGDDPYRIAVRLKHRIVRTGAGEDQRDRAVWMVSLYRADAAFEDAFKRGCAKVASETQLPLFMGTPES